MKKILAITTTMLFAAACGSAVPTVATKGITNNAEATKALGEVNTTMASMISGATPGRQSANVNLKVACDSGSATANLSVTSSGNNAGSGSYNFTFNACKKGDKTVSGTMTWAFGVSQNPTKISLEMNGAIAYEGPTYAGNFSFNALKIAIAQKADNTGYDVTATGTYSVGGTTYTVDNTAAASFFGGGS